MYLISTRTRRWRVLASLLVAGLLAAACGNDSDSTEAEAGTVPAETPSSTTLVSDIEEVTPGGTLVVGLEAESATLLPGHGSLVTNVARAIYDSIAVRGADGEIHPYLAESIEANEDITEWTVTLRPDLLFHDGTPLDAQAIKDNFDEYLNTETSTLTGTLAPVVELRVDGPLTYTYVLDEPNAAFPDVLTGAVGYPFSNEACRAAGDECGSQGVGAGPFKLDSWARDAELRLVRNENYWRTDANGNQLPYLDEVIFRPMPDEESRFVSVLSADIHVGQTLRQSAVRKAQNEAATGRIQSLEAIGNNGGGAVFNTLRPPVDDKRVRQALVYASNQDELIAVLGGAGLTPAQTQFFSPDSPWFSAAVEEVYPGYDTERATELLDEYINDPARSDGKNPGEPVEVSLMCPQDPSLLEVSQALQGFWNGVGVEMDIELVDQAILVSRAIGSADQSPPFAGDYMVTCFRMGSNDDPFTTLNPAFSDPSESPANVSNFVSSTLTEQLEILRTSADFGTRYAAVEEMMFELADEMPLLWAGGTATSLYAVNAVRNLGGWTTPEGAQGEGTMGSNVYWAEVWLEQ